ncbi:hypothetical protein COV06_03055 [Candidatus Uhrbacteria bacterium CG10_big_fil_rev_8_21_14_0_10_50_16]|uniref:Zinc finger DksA/TraR C4-type domain-containing protein n=1 Tax=Candidatus Uhrbacteria bacterium CG10_big_fil_rev_8_21_14_0_10_50_16 TaxID=1975039 RepID=A0A2H0RN50_9BACT|nr:MAG: hypothetical protein COV06_03055 [Candidatus Uhrbacteria bacterium CG10_big_fil_rev_8_21_14_0_10_50_16]
MADKKQNTKDLFSPEFIVEMKGLLEQEREELEKKLGVLGTHAPVKGEEVDVDGTYPEYGDEDEDAVHEIEEFVVNQNLKVECESQLRDVIGALDRLTKGTYGICKYTGEKISEDRLRIRPTSSSSVAAKSAFKP